MQLQLRQEKVSKVNKSRTKSKLEFYCHIFNLIFLLESYSEIKSTWSTAKCRWRKSFNTWYYIFIYAMLCLSFSSKSKATKVFPKHILKSKAHNQAIQARMKLFCCVIVNNYLCNIFNQDGSMWRSKINDQTPQLTLLYCGRIVRSSHWRSSIEKSVLKYLTIFSRKLCLGL